MLRNSSNWFLNFENWEKKTKTEEKRERKLTKRLEQKKFICDWKFCIDLIFENLFIKTYVNWLEKRIQCFKFKWMRGHFFFSIKFSYCSRVDLKKKNYIHIERYIYIYTYMHTHVCIRKTDGKDLQIGVTHIFMSGHL